MNDFEHQRRVEEDTLEKRWEAERLRGNVALQLAFPNALFGLAIVTWIFFVPCTLIVLALALTSLRTWQGWVALVATAAMWYWTYIQVSTNLFG